MSPTKGRVPLLADSSPLLWLVPKEGPDASRENDMRQVREVLRCGFACRTSRDKIENSNILNALS
jgi:hypothetical protein